MARAPPRAKFATGSPLQQPADATGQASRSVPVDADPEPAPRPRRPEPTPAQRALGLLVRREHSRPELARKLAARGIAAEEAASAIDAVSAAGWQDDTRFAISLARSRVGGGYGPQRIRAELASHGLDAEVIAAAFAALAEAGDDDWPALARNLVRRRLGSLKGLELRRRAADLLLRRGFDHDCLRVALAGDED